MVKLDLVAVTPEGKEAPISAAFAAPSRAEDGSWSCLVEIQPFQAQGLRVRGVDSFHATWLACSLILKLLTELKASGHRLLNPDRTEFPLDAYLAGLGGG